MNRSGLLSGIPTLAAILVFASPEVAAGGTLRLTAGGTVMEFEAAPGESNEYSTGYSANGLLGVQDGIGLGVPIAPEAPCVAGSPSGTYTTSNFASCPEADIASVRVLLGDLADGASGGAGLGQLKRMTMYGGAGADRLSGGLDVDTLYGEEGADTLWGSDGADVLDGGAGTDVLQADDGNDVVHAADGEPDTIDCGAGADTAHADPVDSVTNCETTGAAGPPSGGLSPPATVPPSLVQDTADPRILAKPPARVTVRSLIRRGLRVPVGCGEPCTVAMRLELGRRAARDIGLISAARVVVGRGNRRLATAEPATVTVSLSATAKRKLRGAKRLRFALRITAKDLAGNVSRASSTVRARG